MVAVKLQILGSSWEHLGGTEACARTSEVACQLEPVRLLEGVPQVAFVEARAGDGDKVIAKSFGAGACLAYRTAAFAGRLYG